MPSETIFRRHSWLPGLTDCRTGPAEIAEVHQNEHCLADNQLVIHKSPVARIGTVVAVVAHSEIASFGNFAHETAAVVGILAVFQTALLYGISVFRHNIGGIFAQYGQGNGRLSFFFRILKDLPSRPLRNISVLWISEGSVSSG